MKLIILQYVCIIALIGVCYGQFTNQNGQFVANPQQFAGNNQQPGVNSQFQNGQTGLTNQLTNQNFPPSPNAQPGANFPPNQPGTGGFPQNQPGGGFPPTQPGGGFQQNQPGFPQGGQGGGFPGNNQPGGFTGNQPGGGFNQNQQPGFQGNTQPGGFTPNQQPGGFPAPNPQPGAFPAPNPQPGAFPQGTNTAAFGMGRFQTGGFNTIGNNFGNPFVAGNNFGQNPFRGGAQDNTQFTASGQLFMSLSQNPNNYRYATCYFNSSANAIRGRADFRQFLFGESGVDVRVQVVGLPNSPVDTQRGIHIHEFGDIGENCARVGPHFNPTQTRHGGRNSFPFLRHAGDLGNMLQSPQGVSSTQFRDNVISLQGRNSILGRSLVIKYERDDEGTGTNSASQMNGNARTPLACCTIGRASPANWGAPYTEQELMELAGLPFTNTAPAANANSAGGLQTGANNQGQVGNNNQGFNSNTNNNQGFNNNNQGFNNNNQGFNVNNNNDNNQGFNSNNNNNNNNNDFGFNFMNN